MSTEIVEQATLTVDLVLLAYDSALLRVAHVLLINGKFGWSLPGGKVRKDERVHIALEREMQEGIELSPLALYTREFIGVWDEPGRDPRGRYVSFVYRLITSAKDAISPVAGSDAKEVRWFRLGALPKLAFDHMEIVRAAVRALPNGLLATEMRGEKQG